MNLTTNDLLIVIGEQTLQIKALQMMNEAQAKRLAELEKKPENVVQIKEVTGAN